jgi:hypothetical protein
VQPVVTTDRFPLVDVRLQRAMPRDGMVQLVDTYRSLADRGQRMALVIDLRAFDAATSGARDRAHDAAVYRAAAAELRASIVCEARVVHNTVARYIITAFDWLTGVPWPTANFTTPAEAEAWVRRHLSHDVVQFSRASA